MKFLNLIFILLQLYFMNGCPNDCMCIKTSVRCKHKNLRRVPENIPTNTVYLDISDNSIKNLTSHSFSKLKSLKGLRIERNDMKFIHKDAFVGLEHVREIYLANNDLSHLDQNTFSSLKSLLHLYLGGNEFERIPKLLSFSMTRLNLDSNKIVNGEISKSFLRNTELKTVVLTQNHIQEIKENDFINLKNSPLTSLMLKLNNLQKIHMNAFKPLKSTLMTLELEGNKLLGDKIIENALKGFTGSQRLLMLDLKNCGLKNLSSTFFQPLVYSKLHEIDLSTNPDLQNIDSSAFVGLARVKILRIDHCGLRSSDIKFSAMGLLMELSLTHNRFNDCPIRLPGALKKLNLQNNNIRKIYPYNFKRLSLLEELYLQSNSISEIEPNSFGDLTNLKRLDMSFNRLSTIGDKVLVNMNSLMELRLVKQNPCLTRLSGAQFRLRKLQKLELNYNCVTKIDDICMNLPSLTHLNLTNNHLVNLTEKAFTKCSGLIYMDLSKNYLEHWECSTFVLLKSLKFLDLSYNKIKQIVTSSSKPNFLPTFLSLKQVKLSNNNWNCTECYSINWVLYNREFVHNFDLLMCVKTKASGYLSFHKMIGNKCSSKHRTNNQDEKTDKINTITNNRNKFKLKSTILTIISILFFLITVTSLYCRFCRGISIHRWIRERCDGRNNSVTSSFSRRQFFSNPMSMWSNRNRNESQADLIIQDDDEELIDSEVNIYDDSASPKLILIDSPNTNECEEPNEDIYPEVNGPINDIDSFLQRLPRSTSDRCDFVIYCPRESCVQCKTNNSKFKLNYNRDLIDPLNQSNIIYASKLIIHLTSLSAIEKNYYHYIKDLLYKKLQINNLSQLFVFTIDVLQSEDQSSVETYLGVPVNSFGSGSFEKFLYKLL